MEKIKIRDEICSRYYEGQVFSFPYSDLPKDLLPDDIIEFGFEEAYYSENNSWDDHSYLTVYRERLETDEEFEERKKDLEREKNTVELELVDSKTILS